MVEKRFGLEIVRLPFPGLENQDYLSLESIYYKGVEIYSSEISDYVFDHNNEYGTKEEKLTTLLHSIKVLHTVRHIAMQQSNKGECTFEEHQEFEKEIFELACDLTADYVCVNNGVEDLAYELEDLETELEYDALEL
ncbi:MAG: hypothetical protein ACRCTZ_21480 [Sarcina sp.]